MTGGLPQILCQFHDTLGRIDVCVGQSWLRSRGTGLAERGTQPTFVLIVTLTQQGRKKEGICSWLVWTEPCQKMGWML